MLVPIFLIAVALQVWSWSPAAYPFLVFLMITGVMVANNLVFMLLFWQGVTWAGYLILIASRRKAWTAALSPLQHDMNAFQEDDSRGQPTGMKAAFHHALLWQLIGDVLLLSLLFVVNPHLTAPIAADTYTASIASCLTPSTGWLGTMFFILGATTLLLKITAWTLIQKESLSLTFLHTDQMYVNSFWVSITLVALYQTIRLAHVCLPSTHNLAGTIGITVSFMVLAYLLHSWIDYYGHKHLWLPQILPLLGHGTSGWDIRLSLGALDFAVSSLSTLGAACIEFETHLVQLSQGLMRVLLIAQSVPRRIYRLLFSKTID